MLNSRYFVLLFSILFIVACSSSQKAAIDRKGKSPKAYPQLDESKAVAFGRTYIDATKEKLLGNYEKAAKLYQKALAIDPYSAAANYELGVTYNSLSQTDLAFKQFKTASELDPSNYWYKISYATFLQSQNKIDESIEAFKELVEQNPKKIELKYELSKLLLSKERKKEGIQYLNLIEDEIGISEEISFLKQRVYLSDNNVDKAAEEIQRLIDTYPNEIKYRGILADIYLSNGKKEKAFEVFEAMKAIDPENYLVRFSLAEYHRTEGNQEKYLENIEHAFSNPEMSIDDKVKYILTFYQVDSKNIAKKKEGIDLCKKIVQAHPTNAKSFALLADFLYFDNQKQKAKEAYYKTIELDSSRFPVWNQLLVILSETNDVKALINYGGRAVDLFPNQPTVYLLYGLGLARDNQHQKAVDFLELGKDLVIDNQALKSQMYSSIGDSYHELEKHEQSDKNYDKALSLDPNNVYVLNNYSYYLSLRKEKLELAKKMSLKSNTLAPNQASFQDTYAWILFQLGEYEEASEWIDKAIGPNEDRASAVLLEHKGDILFKQGNTEQAIEFWMKAKDKTGASEHIDKKIKDKQFYE